MVELLLASSGVTAVITLICLLIVAVIRKKQNKNKNKNKTENYNYIKDEPIINEPTIDKLTISDTYNHSPVIENPFEIHSFKIAGVTFNNGRQSRQTILRKIKFKDEPFEHEAYIEIKEYEYESAPALAVLANGMQIGNIAANDVSFILDNWNQIEAITAIDVYGGKKNEYGERTNFGCQIYVRFRTT